VSVEPEPMYPKVFLVEGLVNIDRRLPEGGQLMIEVYPDGGLHVAYRDHSWETWPYGLWETNNESQP